MKIIYRGSEINKWVEDNGMTAKDLFDPNYNTQFIIEHNGKYLAYKFEDENIQIRHFSQLINHAVEELRVEEKLSIGLKIINYLKKKLNRSIVSTAHFKAE